MPATIEDLCKVEGKAELVCGEIVRLMPTGQMPNFLAGAIYFSLYAYAMRTQIGSVYTDSAGFYVHLPNRQSFSPDVAYHIGPMTGMKFVSGAPRFAAEVRSDGDYGPKAEHDMAAKRADYFAAGTQVVWDVDGLSEDVVSKYTTDNPDAPTIFRRGEIADAEPAVPGWTMAVDELFAQVR